MAQRGTGDDIAQDHDPFRSPTDAPDEPTDDARRPRHCARVNCGVEAVATMTADYQGRVMAVGPLSPERQPPALDLCARHRDQLTPPDGWELLRHTPEN